MKKSILLVCIICSTIISATAQYSYDIVKDSQSSQTIFKGKCSFDDLNDEASFDWLKLGMNEYNPNNDALTILKKQLPGCEIVIFMGTWCDDTHALLPKLYKTMTLSHCFTNYTMYGVDRAKHSNNKEDEKYKIVNVPTIIVLKNGTEIGRIVETAKESIEQDLVKIVQTIK
jgi:hypothetical protein